jgi:hypothetical protein
MFYEIFEELNICKPSSLAHLVEFNISFERMEKLRSELASADPMKSRKMQEELRKEVKKIQPSLEILERIPPGDMRLRHWQQLDVLAGNHEIMKSLRKAEEGEKEKGGEGREERAEVDEKEEEEGSETDRLRSHRHCIIRAHSSQLTLSTPETTERTEKEIECKEPLKEDLLTLPIGILVNAQFNLN